MKEREPIYGDADTYGSGDQRQRRNHGPEPLELSSFERDILAASLQFEIIAIRKGDEETTNVAIKQANKQGIQFREQLIKKLQG